MSLSADKFQTEHILKFMLYGSRKMPLMQSTDGALVMRSPGRGMRKLAGVVCSDGAGTLVFTADNDYEDMLAIVCCVNTVDTDFSLYHGVVSNANIISGLTQSCPINSPQSIAGWGMRKDEVVWCVAGVANKIVVALYGSPID